MLCRVSLLRAPWMVTWLTDVKKFKMLVLLKVTKCSLGRALGYLEEKEVLLAFRFALMFAVSHGNNLNVYFGEALVVEV